MAGALRNAFSRFPRTCCKWGKARCIRRFIGWSSAAGSALSGAHPTIIAGPSFTHSPAPAKTNWKKNWANGSGSPQPLRWSCSKANEDCDMLKKFRGFFSRKRQENDANDELRFHLEKEIELN